MSFWPLNLFARTPPTPPPGVFPTVEWQVGGHCNYDCSYCIQSKSSRVGQAETDTIGRVIAHLATLPGRWDIKISGGEPFAAKRFMSDVVPGLVDKTAHRVSVLTNFSAPRPTLERFATLVGDRLGIFSASLHLEHTEPEAFIAKALWFKTLRETLSPSSRFVINSVLVPGTLRRLAAIVPTIKATGLTWFPQLMKLKSGVFPYDPDERRIVETLVGHSHDPAEVNRAPSYRGHFCHAGAWYFVLDQQGRAWSCRTSRRHLGTDSPDLGAMTDSSFRRRLAGGPCPFDICPCTVPANRGIIEGVTTRRLDPEWGTGDAGSPPGLTVSDPR